MQVKLNMDHLIYKVKHVETMLKMN